MFLKILIIVLLVLIFFVIGPLLVVQYVVASKLYKLYLVRNEKESWNRDLIPTTKEEELMYQDCNEFEQAYQSIKKEVMIYSDGYKLCGEYYDFGNKRTCIIVAGRSEALRYSFHFAKPYVESGFNILAIDNRSHGFSEGKYNCLGFEEYKDILNWVLFLHNELHNELVIAHGICIGSATILYALTNNACPDYFKGLIADGMYVNFPTSFINHSLEAGYPAHFVTDFFFNIFKKNTKHNAYYGPIDYIDNLKEDIPILFLYSLEDIYSTPDKGQILFDKCSSKKKEIKWFEHGTHSHIRVNNNELYDQTIKEFIMKNYQ